MAEALQKHVISKKHLKFNKSTTKLYDPFNLLSFDKGIYDKVTKIYNISSALYFIMLQKWSLSECGHNTHFVMMTLFIARINTSVHRIKFKLTADQQEYLRSAMVDLNPTNSLSPDRLVEVCGLYTQNKWKGSSWGTESQPA